MDILNTLEELNQLVESSKRVPLMNKCLVPVEDIQYLIATLKKDCPSAVTDAEAIIDEKNKILALAHEEANKIIHQAKDYAKSLVEESEIHKAALAEAEVIRKDAYGEIDKAHQQAEKLRQQATDYAQQILERANDRLTHAMKEVSNLREALMEASASLENYRPEENPPAKEQD